MDTKENSVKNNKKNSIIRAIAVIVILLLIIAICGMVVSLSKEPEELPVEVIIEEQDVEEQPTEEVAEVVEGEKKEEVEEPVEVLETVEATQTTETTKPAEEIIQVDEVQQPEEVKQDENEKKVESVNQQEEDQLPVIEEVTYVKGEKVVLWLDAGHGGRDVGSDVRSIYEKDINISIVNKIVTELAGEGYEILLTRTDDSTVRLYDRVDIINAAKPHLMVSVHCNSVEQDYVTGIESYYAEGKSVGKTLAKYVQESAVAHTGAKDRGTEGSNLVVVKYTTMPATLIEVGFLTNDQEYNNLTSSEYQDKMAKGIAEGIKKFINEELSK